MRTHVTYQRGPHEKSVAVVLHAATVVVIERAGLNRVALANEVLSKNIRNVNILLPPIETIQTAVRVLLELREVSEIILNVIIVGAAEDARAEVVVRKNEATKIRDKGLNTDSRRNEVKVLIHVGQLHFGKCLFQRKLRVGAIRPATHINIHYARFARVEIVRQAECWRNLDRPITWPEGRITMEQLNSELKELIDRERLGLPKEFRAAGTRAADIGRFRRAAQLNGA